MGLRATSPDMDGAFPRFELQSACPASKVSAAIYSFKND